ncbi:hypothetical protein Tco_0967230 [Tanacetum coccineum]
MWPCRVEEKMTLKEVDGKTIQEFETKIIAKDGTITRVPGTFQGYEMSEEDSVERPKEDANLYGFVDHPQLQQRKDEDEVERNEVDSDLESTASSKPVWKKTTEADRDLVEMDRWGIMAAPFKTFNLCNPRSTMGKVGLEVSSIRRIQGIGYDVLEFLGVGTTFDIFQNIIFIPYFQYGVLVFTGYGVLIKFPLWSLVSAGTDTPYLLDRYGVLVFRIVIFKISLFKLQNARLLLIFTKYSIITAILKYK